MSTAPQVLLVDDHELVRVGVKSAVTEVRGVAVRWLEADTLEEAIRIFAVPLGLAFTCFNHFDDLTIIKIHI